MHKSNAANQDSAAFRRFRTVLFIPNSLCFHQNYLLTRLKTDITRFIYIITPEVLYQLRMQNRQAHGNAYRWFIMILTNPKPIHYPGYSEKSRFLFAFPKAALPAAKRPPG